MMAANGEGGSSAILVLVGEAIILGEEGASRLRFQIWKTCA